jgi:hypothetical protein
VRLVRLVRMFLQKSELQPNCHLDRSEAERRDLRFRGPFVEMFFDRAQRSGEICGFSALRHPVKAIVRAAPILFGPCTLGRTWGTRPISWPGSLVTPNVTSVFPACNVIVSALRSLV